MKRDIIYFCDNRLTYLLGIKQKNSYYKYLFYGHELFYKFTYLIIVFFSKILHSQIFS